MLITDFDSSEQDQMKGSNETTPLKWRRSGVDRRLERGQTFSEGKRGMIGRRIDWFELISNFVFPRHSKMK